MGEFIDDEDGFGGDILPHNSMEAFTDYQSIEVSEVDLKLRKRAKKFIDGVSSLYLKAYSSTDDQYIIALKKVETDNLVVMLKQVKYAEHILDTLIKRFNMGGYVDSTIYDEIRQMQQHVIAIMGDVTRYTRGVPDFFKFTESEFDLVTKIKDVNDVMLGTKTINQEQSTPLKIESTEAVVMTDVDDMNKPNRGTKTLMMKLDNIGFGGSIDEVNKNYLIHQTWNLILILTTLMIQMILMMI